MIGGLGPRDLEIIWESVKYSGYIGLDNPTIQKFKGLIERDKKHFTVFRLNSPTRYFTVSNEFLKNTGLHRDAADANFLDKRLEILNAANEAEKKRAKKKEVRQKAKNKKTKKKSKSTKGSKRR